MKLSLLPLLGLIAASSAQTLSCGNVGDSSFTTASGDETSLSISKSSLDNMCMLFRITAIKSADLNAINPSSNLADYNMVPVSRSYHGNDWQRVAGAYAQNLEIECSANECLLDIPILPNQSEGRFVLMPFEYELPANATVSRFFHQTTFGPTISMIKDWDYSTDLEVGMTSWVKDQMNSTVTPITSHREFFRRNANGMLEYEEEEVNLGSRRQVFKARHMCEPGARWVKHAFTADDYDDFFEITEEPDGTWLVTDENGIKRTILQNFTDDDGNQLQPGTYEMNGRTDEFLGGRVKLNSIYLGGGNPQINLPLDTPNYTFVNLPAESEFKTTSPISFGKYYYEHHGESLYLENGLSSDACDSFDPTNTQYIIGVLSGCDPNVSTNCLVRYGRYFELNENTVDSPGTTAGYGIETCSNVKMNFLNAESCRLQTDACNSDTYYTDEILAPGSLTLVCGSNHEVANDPKGDPIFQLARATEVKNDGETQAQKRNVWSMIALSDNTKDQLRQRVAWALSQILVITQNQINRVEFSELYLAYYDIFTRNAFGNYFDILKEVSYSPMMGEMLSYVGSKSLPYILEDQSVVSYPDENYAREIMQLFSIGLYKLKIDGTLDLDEHGQAQLSYTDEDIQNFARAWTGFDKSTKRSNMEYYYYDGNRLDPMVIYGPYRDFSPKFSLDGGYIGDGYQLCTDLPSKHFLKVGATYRLLGSSLWPLLHTQDDNWFKPEYNLTSFELSSISNLYTELCADGGNGCDFSPVVTLDTNLACVDDECALDDLRIVKVQSDPPIFYEYVRVPCVEHTFYDDSKAKTIQHRSPRKAMCANGELPLAMEACCENPTWGNPTATTFCEYSAEKTTFNTSSTRCSARYVGGEQCAWSYQNRYDNGSECHLNYNENYYWASSNCALEAKISRAGTVAVVHRPGDLKSLYSVDINADENNLNYFRVDWKTDFPKQSVDSCGTDCTPLGLQDCLCAVSVSESAVFFSLPTLQEVQDTLKVGGIDVTMEESFTEMESSSSGDVVVYEKNGGGYNTDTIFKITHGAKHSFLKNVESTVNVGSKSFRNPVQFLNPALREARDAAYETDAVLKHYFEHKNTAPFLAMRMIERFGTSNPSPEYVRSVAEAFKTGYFEKNGVTFGKGDYGSMEAMVAAIILHEESREVILDTDPTSGSLKEPLLKLISFMKSMEFRAPSKYPEIALRKLQDRLGQGQHETPSVFSYFLPEYMSPGHIEAATLVSPEAQVLNSPALTAHINGHFSLVDMGLSECYGGFGEQAIPSSRCYRVRDGREGYSVAENSKGTLTYVPSSPDEVSVVDEIASLLTAGRLSSHNRAILESSYIALGSVNAVQKLITTTPEFHTLNSVVNDQGVLRDSNPPPPAAEGEYRAVVFFNLRGGADTWNLLVPHSNCREGIDMYQHYKDVRTEIALNKDDLLQIDASNSNQICDTFGIHPNLGILQSLYNDTDLLFISNIGVLQQYATKENWRGYHDDTSLFAHNEQQMEVQRLDILEELSGTGVGGRLLDVLKSKGFSTNALSTSGIEPALSSSFSPLLVVPSVDGYEKIDPMSFDRISDTSVHEQYTSRMRELNSATNIGSSLFSETYSSLLQKSLDDNSLLYDALKSVTLNTTFPDESTAEGFDTISRLIKTRNVRGVDRDVFYVDQGGFDMHSELLPRFEREATDMNAALEAFVTEMKDQGLWDDVTIVVTTEFARTLTTNSGIGSDHAWGGNLMVLGGSVDGKKILGEYPDDLSYENGSLIINRRGVVLPTTPWDSVWHGVAQWFGVTDENDLAQVLPNKEVFGNTLFTSETLFGISVTSSPTSSSSPTTSPAPSDPATLSMAPSLAPSLQFTRSIAWYNRGSFVEKTVIVGEIIKLTWDAGLMHDVHYSVDGTCNPGSTSNPNLIPISLQPPAVYPFTIPGKFTFVCKRHCEAGHGMIFNVITSESPSAAPSESTPPTIDPNGDLPITFVSQCSGSTGNLCDLCQGDCDNDNDCAGDLVCRQRQGFEPVDGCKDEGLSLDRNGTDVCSHRFETIKFVGQCKGEDDFFCGVCEGDCDSDSDCSGDLVCRNRSEFEPVHGCSREGGSTDRLGADICSYPFEVIEYVGQCKHEEGFLCGLCEGDCDEDADCAEGLVCAQRPSGSYESVNGCSGEGSWLDKAGSDICVYPEKPVEFVKECSATNGLCSKCEGDCDTDADCSAGLVCKQRSGNEPVEHCSGEGGISDLAGKDICTYPENQVEYIGECNGTNGNYCGECQGDCDSDSDCLGDLVCRNRGSVDPFAAIHGCVGEGGPLDTKGGADVCSHPFEVIEYVGECKHEEGFLCGLCEGDCDEDADCAEGLVCGRRDDYESMSGCSGEGGFSDTKKGSDICIYPNKPIEYVKECSTTNGLCGLCSGDCDSDADCEAGLVCFQRDSTQAVPNCGGEGGISDVAGKDICTFL